MHGRRNEEIGWGGGNPSSFAKVDMVHSTDIYKRVGYVVVGIVISPT